MALLRRIRLKAFRNFDELDLALPGGVVAFAGPNGQGKSNLLEAVYMVATGRSHRTVQEAEAVRHGESASRVRALVSRRGRDEEIELTLRVEGGRLSTEMRVSGAPIPRGGVLGRLPVVIAAPWDLELVRGPASGRRRMLDGALAQLSPGYFFALHRYHRVVAQRNVELRRKAPQGLDPWDAQMVTLGGRITAYRTAHLRRMAPLAASWFGRLGGQGRLALGYAPSWKGEGEEEIVASAREAIARLRADEIRRGATLSGPHRDDVTLGLDHSALRANGSQGQWRTAMLAVRLAEREVLEAELGDPPVLLLDDALAELDPGRQRRVLELGVEGQILLTTTLLPATDQPVRVFRVEAGVVVPGER